MNIEVPYNALILGALNNIIKYENRHDLKIEDLENYLHNLLKVVLEVYNITKGEFFKFANWEGEIAFNKDDDYIHEFLHKYGHICTLEDNTLKVKETIDAEDIYQIFMREVNENNVDSCFLAPLEDLDLLKILNITKIPNLIKKMVKIEEEVEKAYFKAEYDEAYVAFKALERIIFLNRLGLCREDVINNVIALTVQMQARYEKDFFPVDFAAFKDSPYYEEEKPYLDEDKVSKMCNFFNKAIFGDGSLKYEKLLLMLEDVYEYKVCGKEILNHDVKEGYDDPEEILEATAMFNGDELCFCYKYLQKLTDFLELYGENADLERVKSRLMYVIDDPSIEIIDPEVLDEYILDSEDVEIDEEPLSDFASETYFLCEDIFKNTYSIATVKKLLFISAYYEVTHDAKIKEIIKMYRNYAEYNYYFQIIFGYEPDKNLKREI